MLREMEKGKNAEHESLWESLNWYSSRKPLASALPTPAWAPGRPTGNLRKLSSFLLPHCVLHSKGASLCPELNGLSMGEWWPNGLPGTQGSTVSSLMNSLSLQTIMNWAVWTGSLPALPLRPEPHPIANLFFGFPKWLFLGSWRSHKPSLVGWEV